MDQPSETAEFGAGPVPEAISQPRRLRIHKEQGHLRWQLRRIFYSFVANNNSIHTGVQQRSS